MDRMMIRYRVKPDELERHLELLRDVYEELESTKPEGFRWATFRINDETSFVDVVSGNGLPGPLPQLESFRRYRATLDDRCEGRAATELEEVGSYRFP
ncbi:MAG: hypothetical protein AVDCRST_MAG02-2058 [uncultured Rubrobacteraceae bacterium]|uniref:NIPSNAP domain-containing protein n=1 Tax=uncultured Rubrobacteraceae bacterium TaxID=349277 RepID=A0A6J4R7Q9_9ACTN|nr:MAG: hypothetical protein AVDCRST_MAG02-2058 [uncultured Rubrobacteraceae bacterium]